MLTFTDEGREAIYDALTKASYTGDYGNKYKASLHTCLSHLNLRRDNIVLSWGTSYAAPDKENVKFIFKGEFALQWLNDEGKPYMHGGLIWHEASEEFSTHT